MAYQPVDGALQYVVSNVTPYTKQGTAFNVGGSFTTLSGQPSQQLLPSTNQTLGYFVGQMLSYAVGDGSGIYAGLTPGAMVNWDPSSSDTGQQIFNKYVIVDQGLKFPLLKNTTYLGVLQCATAGQGWVMRQQFLYGGGTPATDISVVQTAIRALGYVQSQTMNSSGSSEIIFAFSN